MFISTFTQSLPDIPRFYTALAEWAACLVYIICMTRTVTLKRTVTISALGCIMLIVTQYVAGTMPLPLWIPGMLMSIVVMLVTIMSATGTRRFVEGLYFVSRAFVLAELVASLEWQIDVFIQDHYARWNMWMSIAFMTIVYALLFTVAWRLEHNAIDEFPQSTIAPQHILMVGLTAIIVWAMSNMSFISTNELITAQTGYTVFYIRTLVDLCGYVILYAQQEQLRDMVSRTELYSINNRLLSQHNEYLQSKKNLEAVSTMAHDLKHQIVILRAEINADYSSNASQSLDALEDSVNRFSAQQHSGNPVLDVILTSKQQVCREKGINFTAVADGAALTNLSSMDMATLFGNALDNAIEATQRLDDPQKRLIKLAVYSQDHFVVIRLENYFEGKLQHDSEGQLVTTKRDKRSHGYGLKSIRHIVGRLGGHVTSQVNNGWFDLRILLPNNR